MWQANKRMTFRGPSVATMNFFVRSQPEKLSPSFLARFRRRRRTSARRACASDQFSGCIENGITSLLAGRIITVNDSMEKSAVLRTLGFFEYATHIVVLVATLEPKPPVRPGNFGAGKMASVVEFITNGFGVCHLGRWSSPQPCAVHCRNCKRSVSRQGASIPSHVQHRYHFALETGRSRRHRRRREACTEAPAWGGKIS